MSAITTHILDTSRGRPAAGVAVQLELETAEGWKQIGQGSTDSDGRVKNLLSDEYDFQPGVYRLTFDTESYFRSQQIQGFYREVAITFTVPDAAQHYHVPLLLNPFGYSTYRGS